MVSHIWRNVSSVISFDLDRDSQLVCALLQNIGVRNKDNIGI